MVLPINNGMNTVNITHLETIYKNCDESGIKTDPARSHLVRFCDHTSHSHATIMSLLSPAFLNAQQLADENVSNEPYHITVLWTISQHLKRKPENAETAYEAILYFIKNLKAPKNGAVISIYRAKDAYSVQTTQWRHSQIWPFEKQWEPQGDYVTVHQAERLMSKSRINQVKTSEEKILPLIEKCAQNYGFEIKYINYTLTIKEIVDTMRLSNYHFCYSGATYYTAAMIGIPALAWHDMDTVVTEEHPIRNRDGILQMHKVQRNTWGAMSSNIGKIRQYDWKNDCVITEPNQTQRHIEYNQEIEAAFLRMIKND